MNSSIKTIKSVHTKRFKLDLIELPSGFFKILIDKDGNQVYSETINDMNTVMFMYDMKLRELEGQ